MNLSQMTKRQKIIAGVVGFLLLVLAIVGLYFAFKKPTPKPTNTSTPETTNTSTPETTNTSTPKTTNTSSTTTVDSNPIVIVGTSGKILTLTDKAKFVNSNGADQSQKGCWSLDTDNEWKDKLKYFGNCRVKSITLPSDIKATAYTSSGRWTNLCSQKPVEDLDLVPGKQHNVEGKFVCGFKFEKV